MALRTIIGAIDGSGNEAFRLRGSSATGKGTPVKISGATCTDLAAAAAAVVLLAGDEQAGKIYELGGTAFTMAGLAAEASRQTGKPLTYQDMPVDQYAKALAGAGLPAAFADLLADTSLAAARGDWYTDSTDLPRLIGRPSTPWPPPSPMPSRPAPPTPATPAADTPGQAADPDQRGGLSWPIAHPHGFSQAVQRHTACRWRAARCPRAYAPGA
jgi:hypothetical protein